jgi:uncharacterized membrane protein YeaQ/YmgE (transglycosylase-associated protein family)
MNDRLQPALWGGVFIGVLSALPLVSAGNCCCCLWVLVGGALAAYLRQQNTPYQITASEGAIVGVMAGLIGAVIGSLLAIPFQMMTGPMQQQMMERVLSENPDITPEMRAWIDWASNASGLWIIGLLFSLCVYSVFGVFGGLLGVAIFKKNVPPPPPGTIDVTPSPVVPPPPPPTI